MAKHRICSITDCDKTAISRTWCRNHYRRWKKHGDPLGGRTCRGEVAAYLANVVLPFSGDDCLLWPYSRTAKGYAQVRHEGRIDRVHVLVCERVRGPRPFNGADAAHSCGNGHLGCVNPHHLSWKTHAENMADMVEHGTSPNGERHGMAKLTENEVKIIRASLGRQSRRWLSDKFGVSIGTIKDVQTRRSWGWLE